MRHSSLHSIQQGNTVSKLIEKQARNANRFVLAAAHCTLAFLLLATIAETKALIAAKLDDPPRYDAAVAMVAGGARRCSATKIAEKRFLTAAHCLADTSTGTLASAFATGRKIEVSNAVIPRQSDFVILHVERADMHPDFVQVLERFHSYKEKIINEYRNQYEGADLEQRIRRIEADNHITGRYPDLAVVTVRESTPGIPIADIDFAPLTAEESVHLVGYGCEISQYELPASEHGRRRWGETRVIRIDPVNFYTFAHRIRPGSPSLCPGDSGGPVMRTGKVVGVNGTAYGLNGKLGARSNMSVNLGGYKAWAPLH
jgi:hypothetical protein